VRPRDGYIVGPAYDWAFFLLPPTLSLALGIFLSGTALADAPRSIGGVSDTATGFFIGTVVHAHLVAVFVRSHGNRQIFRLHPVRFVALPILLWVAIVASPFLAAAAAVVATFWDVWHSGAQTFGFARIYDRNHGVPPALGRRIDFWMNQLLYAGPILAGVTLVDHMRSFDEFEGVGATFLTRVPAEVAGFQRTLAIVVLVAGGALCLAYLWWNVRLARRGHGPSFEKVFLVVSTGLCSIYTWGWNSWGEAFFIMNLFHAVQYLALVWAAEKKNLMARIGLAGRRGGEGLLLGGFLALVLGYGFAVQLLDPGVTTLWAITMVVSLMHFYYDAFIWSVRKQQI